MGGGFEPPKATPSDLQSDPFGRSGTPPHFFYGAGTPNRTEDILITSEMLYLLSYIGLSFNLRQLLPLQKDRQNISEHFKFIKHYFGPSK